MSKVLDKFHNLCSDYLFRNAHLLRKTLHPEKCVPFSELCKSVGVDFDSQSAAIRNLANRKVSQIITPVSRKLTQSLKGSICYCRDDAQARILMNEGAIAIISNREIADCVCLVVDNPLEVYCRMCNFYRRMNNQVSIATVIGSIGKSTTKNMVASVYSADQKTFAVDMNFNTEHTIGFFLQHIPKRIKRMVWEVAESIPNRTAIVSEMIHPHVAVITAIDKSHFAVFGDEMGIVKEVCDITAGLDDSGCVIVNKDEFSWYHLLRGKKVVTISLSDFSADYYAKDIRIGESGLEFVVVETASNVEQAIRLTNIFARHNIKSALSAFAAGRFEGIPHHVIAKGLADFRTTDVRQNVVKANDGVTIYADCYNAIPRSVRSAVSTCDIIPAKGKRYVVLGDIEECGDISDDVHNELIRIVSESKFDVFIPVGKKIIAALSRQQLPESIQVQPFNKNEDVEDYLAKVLVSGDLVLFKASHASHLDQIIKFLWPNEYRSMMGYNSNYKWWLAKTSVC